MEDSTNKNSIKRIILLVLFVIITILLSRIFRNYFILKEVFLKNIQYTKYAYDYYKLTIGYENGLETNRVEGYRKGNMQALFMEQMNKAEGDWKAKEYSDGSSYHHQYFYSGDSLISYKENEVFSYEFVFPYIGSDIMYAFNRPLSYLFASINEEIINGKSCYKIKNFVYTDGGFWIVDYIYYFEKDTGLLLRTVESDGSYIDYDYSFGDIDDSIFIEPSVRK